MSVTEEKSRHAYILMKDDCSLFFPHGYKVIKGEPDLVLDMVGCALFQ